MIKPKSDEDTRRFADMVAAKQGWELNPDEGFLGDLLRGLTTNWNRHGYYLCPCRDSSGSRETDAGIICPCAPSRPDIEQYGHCFCALYLRPDFKAAGGTPCSIPDRQESESRS